MGLKAGIIGLPNVGKSTLFNAITKKNILAANFPFATIDPNIGVVTVPDHRLEVLEKMYIPERTIPTSYEFIDIAGLIKGASKGEGLGNKFLSNIRDVDAICEVIRCFDDDSVIHVEGNVDPIRDVETINIELALSDLEIIETRISKIEKKAQSSKEKDVIQELDLLNKLRSNLLSNTPIRDIELNVSEETIIKPFNFLTKKPIIYIANIKEEDIGKENKYLDRLKKLLPNSEIVEMCAKVESELSEMNDDDKYLFLKELGIKESGLDKLIKSTYNILGLATFFTVGPDECRAWTFKKNMKAPECAGIIHSDFEKGFIRAEVISYDDLITYGSELKVKEAGKMRLEGKTYLMQDGDICYFRFNV